jgi:pyruvate dehydrogenase E1 component
LLYALSQLGQPGGTSAYFRLTTRPLDQALAQVPSDAAAREARRQAVLSGGYRLRTATVAPALTLVGAGAVLPELCGAADMLEHAGVPCDVVCLTSADLLYRALQARRGLRDGSDAILDTLFPPDRATPIVSVLDGHPHTLSFLSGIRCVPMTSLGVDDFGQSGDVADLYNYFGIDTETVVGAAIDLLEAQP